MQGTPRELGLDPETPKGFVIAPHSVTTELLVTLRITGKAGRYVVPGLVVHYHVNGSEKDLFLAEGMAVCYPFSTWRGRCVAPLPTEQS